MKAVIMAGGEGTRLRPLTSNLPKPMVPIANRPVMEYIIDLLASSGIKDIGVTTYYLPSYISDYFGDGEKFGVNLNYYTEESPLGTGGSVLNTGICEKDTFLVISGDSITDINLNDAIKYHMQKKSKATLILKKESVPLEYGIVILDEEGRISRFLEKPNWGEVFSDTINTGIYILDPEIFNYYKKGDNFDFSKDLFPRLLKDDIPMYGYVADGYWCDIGDFQSYKQTQFDLLNKKINVNNRIKMLKPGVFVDDNTILPKNTIINPPVYIGKDCIIKKGVVLESYTIIGDHCEIGENTTIKKSIIWDKVSIGKNVQCRGTTICSRALIKDNVNLFENSIIGAETILKNGVTVKPDIKIWPCKTVSEDTIVNSNLVWGSRLSKVLFSNTGVSGEVNIDITPEFASSLGSAFASALKAVNSIIVSSDGLKQSEFIKNSIISGILSTGANVISINNVTTPISRYSVRFYKASGGINLRTDATDENKIHIEFFNKNGGTIDRKTEKSIEHIFHRGDFERCNSDKIKEIMTVENFTNLYLQTNVNTIKNIPEIRDKDIKVLVSSNSQTTVETSKKFLEIIGCKVDIASEIRNSKSVNDYLLRFSKGIKRNNFDLGLLLSDNGEKLILFDNKGNIVGDDKYAVLSSLIALKTGSSRNLIIPLTATSIIEKMAKDYNAEIKKTKSSASEIMNEMLKNSENENNALTQYKLNFDGILAAGIIIDYLASRAIALNDLLNELPSFHIKKSEIKCDFQSRGYVIRKLIEENSKENLELFEGVKIITNHGWSLILPDNDKPIFNIYTEGFTEEYANELTYKVNDKIQYLLKNIDAV